MPKAQADYLQFLLQKATDTAIRTKPLAFDPQGRVIIDVTLTAQDYVKILPPDGTKAKLEEAMGRKISDTTTVSLDVQDIPELRDQFKLGLESELNKLQKKKPTADLGKTEKILGALEKTPKGSVIALQQELHFHLNLVARTCQTVLKKAFPDDKKDEALHDALLKMNQLVMKSYAEALDAAYVNGGIDVGLLNTRLDHARKDLTKVAHSVLRHEMEKRGVTIPPKTTFDELAEKITATPNDLVHNSCEMGLVTLIEGSENTAHNRLQKEKFAHREILTHKYKRDEDTNACVVSEKRNPRIQIRTPSLDLKDKQITEHDEIEDIKIKMGHVIQHYQLQNKLPTKGDGIPKAYVYNLHTAINGWTSQEGKNKQTRGAQRILKASHAANAKQLSDNPGDPTFCFVQNISVNGFGDSLGPMNWFVRGVRKLFRYDNDVHDEATLMADMALMHTLYSTASGPQQLKIKDVMQQYKDYLADPKRPEYFAQSTQATKAAEIISGLKTEWKNEKAVAKPEDVLVNAKSALKFMIANNLHYSHDYAKLVQTLSIFVEDASIAGCKSGNERAQSISGRVAILDALANASDFLAKNSELAIALQALASGKDLDANVEKFKTSLDKVYNDEGLQTATSLISMVDQGAAAKVVAKTGLAQYYNTNYGEESADVLSNLHQSKASAMQAHGGLTESMEETWNMARGKNEQVVALSGVQPLKVKENIQQVKERLIGQIGKYGADDFDVSSILSPEGVSALHSKVDKYRNKKKSAEERDDPNYNRKEFIKYLFSYANQERIGLSLDERAKFQNQGNPKGAAIKMENLLDETGIMLYQKALEEERCSKEFMQATLKACTEHHEGEKWSQRMVVPLGGPSASGKTFGATSVVAKAAEFMPKEKGNMSGNDVVSVDGAVPREVSQMRKLMIEYAVNLGYTGVTNLHGKSKVLGSVKEDIAKAAFKTPGLNMVIPETFADPGKAPALISALKKLKDMKLIFARVDSNDESFRPTVAYNGEKRAWKTDKDAIPDYDLNMAKKYLPESKDYEGQHFEHGRGGTSRARTLFEMFFPKMMKMEIVYGLILVKPVGNNDWEQTNAPGPGVESYSKIVFDAWKKLTPQERLARPLPQFNKEELSKIGGAVIKTADQLSLESTAFKLEKRMQDIGETRVQPVIDQIKELHGLFKQSKWEEYQSKIDLIRLNIKSVLELPRPLPMHAIEKLEKLNVKLEKARENVPEAFKKPAPKIEMPTDRTLMAKTSILGFEREVIPSRTSSVELLKHVKPKDTDGTRLESENNMITECQGVKLKEGEHIRSYLKFSQDHTALLVQNHRGRVDNYSSSNLEPHEKVMAAVEQAQMMLINWKPDAGPIIIKGKNPETANMVYAALLLLKDCDKRFSNLSIKSWVPNCTGPGTFEFQSTFINRHLGNEKEGVLTADLRESLKRETATLVASKSSEFLKDKLQKAKPTESGLQEDAHTLQTRLD